jgi:hypothetical protein
MHINCEVVIRSNPSLIALKMGNKDWFDPNSYDQEEVAHYCFILAVTFIAIAPRMPFDRPWTIGGDISQSFRKLLICIISLYFIRHLLNNHLTGVYRLFLLVLHASEGIAISFLTLLTPYLLRFWLSSRINVPGGRRPGIGLMPWVYTFVALSAFGVILRFFTRRSELWIFKKIADALSFIPVQRTIQLYNSFITAAACYPGRGNVLSQVVMVSEYYALIANLCDIGIKCVMLFTLVDPDFEKSGLVRGVYANNFFGQYTRILCHSIFLNVLDEMHHLTMPSQTEHARDADIRSNTTDNPRQNRVVSYDISEGDDIDMATALVPNLNM